MLRQDSPHRIGAWFSMELGLDLPSPAKDGAARPQREGEWQVPRVLPRRRVADPLRLVPEHRLAVEVVI